MIDNLYIFKFDVKDRDAFDSLIGLHNCIVAKEDELYYIVEGSPEDIEMLRQDWIKYILKGIEKHKEKLYNVQY